MCMRSTLQLHEAGSHKGYLSVAGKEEMPSSDGTYLPEMGKIEKTIAKKSSSNSGIALSSLDLTKTRLC